MFDTTRTLLFVPGDSAHRLTKALASHADAIVADLEDSISPAAKDVARATVAAVLARRNDAPAVMVRVNAFGSELERDLAAIEDLVLDAIVVPKATPASVSSLGSDGPPLVALIETATGLAHAAEVANTPRVGALALGSVDLSAELGLESLEMGAELLYARSKLVLDCAQAGIRPPFDSAFVQLSDIAGLQREARHARALGMRGKICIHPEQVGPVNRVFREELDVEWARSAIAAYEADDSRGVVADDGQMVDLAVIKRARRILREAGGTV